MRIYGDASESGRASITNGPPEPAPPGAAGSHPTKAGTCFPPKSVSIAKEVTLEFPDDLTTGGICTVMEVSPTADNLCEVYERVGTGQGNTCPASIANRFCRGMVDRPFPFGKSAPDFCPTLEPKANQFIDRHALHDRSNSALGKDHPKPCDFTCDQDYYLAPPNSTTIGRFSIRYSLKREKHDGGYLTRAIATKTAREQPSSSQEQGGEGKAGPPR